jgi:soluble lytic murein transglycosylase-like protein
MFEFDRPETGAAVAVLFLMGLAPGTATAEGQPTRVPAPQTAVAAVAPAGPYGDLIARHAARHGVPPALADAVVRIESRHNARARNGSNIGLTQISFATARRMGYAGGVEGLYDPDTNLGYGLRYLGDAYRLAGGDTCMTVLKYQAGHGAKRMTSAAGSYCAKVRTHLAAAH